MGSQYFHRLEDALHGLATDPAIAGAVDARAALRKTKDCYRSSGAAWTRSLS